MKPEIMKWVKIVVLKTIREKRLGHLDVDMLLSSGYLGYSQSLKRFDPGRGVKFKTFAEYRIKGAVLDEVRKMIGDERCKTKRPRQVSDFDFNLMGDNNSSKNMIESMLDVQKFFKEIPIDKRNLGILKCRIEGMNLREIGNKFGFSESRASQLLAEIKREIFPWFKEYLGANFKLIKINCPKCSHINETIESVSSFDCESCNSDVIIVDGQPQLKVPEFEYDEASL